MPSQYSLTPDDLEEIFSEQRLIELTDDAGGEVAPIAAVIVKAIEAVEAELHQYAGVFFQVPLRESDGTTVPAGVRERLLYAIGYRLMTRRPEWLNAPTEEAQYWPRVRKDWLKWLEDLAAKRATIPGAVERSAPASSTSGGANLADQPARKFDDLGSLY